MKKIVTIFCCILFSSVSHTMNKKFEPHISKTEAMKTLETILYNIYKKNMTVIKIPKKLYQNTKNAPKVRELLKNIENFKSTK